MICTPFGVIWYMSSNPYKNSRKYLFCAWAGGLSPQGVLRRLDFIVIMRRSASLRSFNSLKSSGTSRKTVNNCFSLVYLLPKNPRSLERGFFYPSRRLGMPYSPFARRFTAARCATFRFHGTLTEQSALAPDKRACRFASLDYHALACIYLRLDDIQCFALMIYRNKLRMIYTPFGVIGTREFKSIQKTLKNIYSVRGLADSKDERYRADFRWTSATDSIHGVAVI